MKTWKHCTSHIYSCNVNPWLCEPDAKSHWFLSHFICPISSGRLNSHSESVQRFLSRWNHFTRYLEASDMAKDGNRTLESISSTPQTQEEKSDTNFTAFVSLFEALVRIKQSKKSKLNPPPRLHHWVGNQCRANNAGHTLKKRTRKCLVDRWLLPLSQSRNSLRSTSWSWPSHQDQAQ